jgi:hypothetical protein
VTPLVHLVADYGPGDLAFAQTVQRLALVAPEAQICPTLAADTLAAGLCVAALALAAGPADRVVLHDVAGPAGDDRMWIGRTREGVLIVGAARGCTWSFVAPALDELCALDLPVDADIARALRRAVTKHPHAICAVIGRDRVPAPPDCVLAWTDRAGNLQTTLAAAPAERVTVRIGDHAEPARLGSPADGELVLEPGTRGLQRLAVGGGSAAERFGGPPAGMPVEVTPVARARARGGRRRASSADRRRP